MSSRNARAVANSLNHNRCPDSMRCERCLASATNTPPLAESHAVAATNANNDHRVRALATFHARASTNADVVVVE